MALSSPLSSQGPVQTESLFDGELPSDFEFKRGAKYLIDTVPNLRTLPLEYVMPLTRNSLLASYASIPIIDISGFDGPPDSRKLTTQAIDSACAEWGIFRVVNHGMKISLMEEMLEATQGFFNLPWEEKMKYDSGDPITPFVKFGTSLPSKQWFDYLRHQNHSSQHWPNNPPNYRNVAKEYLEEVWQLSMKIGSAISEGLGLESDYIETFLGEGWEMFTSKDYPPCPEPHRIFGMKPHTDITLLTVIFQNDIDGFQVEHEGDWVAVEHVPGTFVFIVGDSMEILSNGRYKTLKHRCVTNAERRRISVLVGIGPEMTTAVAPASPLVDEKSEIKYRHVTYKDYTELKIKGAINAETSPLQFIIVDDATNGASSVPLPKV